MKEQTDSHSQPSSTYSQELHRNHQTENKSAKPAKTRQIHKDKGHQASEKEKIKLSKQERAKIQKEKNRQAAQRSRDMHKQYVSTLEKELNNLREQLAQSSRYCRRCRQSLQNQEVQMNIEQNIQISAQNQVQSLQGTTLVSNQPAQQFNEPDSFLRILQPHEENSLLKLMLFVCMVIIGVMIGYGNKEPAVQQPRSLVQVYSDSISNAHKQDAVQITQMQEWSSDKGLVQLSREVQDPMCLDSLMKVEAPVVRKSLRSIHDSSYNKQQDAIMLCSLRFPKQYQIKAQYAQTPLVKLFVVGSQIKELVQRSGVKILDRNIQLNGIYKLSAQIKNIELVSHHNCIL